MLWNRLTATIWQLVIKLVLHKPELCVLLTMFEFDDLEAGQLSFLFPFEAPSSLAGVHAIILLGQIVGCWIWVFLEGGECDCTFRILHKSCVQDNPQYVTLLKSAVTKSLFTNITVLFYWFLQEITALGKCVVAFAKMTRVVRFLTGNFRFRG